MESREESEDHKEKNTTNSNGNTDNSKTPFVIKIPSYDEVVGEAETAPNQPLFNPSSSFSEAFNFVKNSEFYTSPPISSTSRQSSTGPTPSVTPIQRQIVQQEVASSSNSTGASRNSILVSHRQKGNPLLKHIRNVRWVFADVVCDYLVGQNACALYLSLRYHLLHPDYLYFRIRELQKNFKLRVVLCHVDVEDVVKPLLEVTKTALLHDCTLLCGWSLEECARYLETIKVYENKSADLIQGQVDMDYLSRLNHALTTVRHVNKTDVVTLGSTFGSLAHVMDASMEDLARCPGIGERKVKRLYDTFHEPFKRVIPRPSTINEVPVENRNRFESQNERHDKDDAEISEDTTGKQRKKEGDVSVRDALKAAFAKCSNKIPRKHSASQLEDVRQRKD